MLVKDKKPRHTVWENIRYLLADIAVYSKLLLVLIGVEVIFAVILPLMGIYLPKLAVELAAEGAKSGEVLWKLGWFALLLGAARGVKQMADRAKYIYSNDMRVYYQAQIMMKSFSCRYEQVGSSSGLDRFQKAVRSLEWGDGSGTSVLLYSAISLFVAGTSFLLLAGLISIVHPLMVVYLIVLSGVNYAALRWARNYEQSRRGDMAGLERKLHYVEYHSADVRAAKDVRIYGMAGWFMMLRDQLLDSYASLLGSIKQRHYRTGLIQALTMLLRDGAAYAYLIWLVTAGDMSVGDFVLYFGAVTGFSGWVQQLVDQLNRIQGASLQMNDMRDFLERSDDPEPEYPHPLPAPGTPLSIEFRGVSYSYGMEEGGKVIDNLSLRIGPGEKLALVGLNGAGKSTLVKLLCGFHKPDSGEILINGLNINGYRTADLYGLISAVFQEITILPFTVSENVSMMARSETDASRVWDCLQQAGLDKEIRRHPAMIDTPMLKVIKEEGILLSGGQQQKLLMARALYKDAPILILDEPTAALDPIAESETYESFHRLSLDKTAIYISHRLASTRFCDRVALIRNGAIAEIGTHAELMGQGGEYARMYEIQSHYYKSGGVSA